MGFVVITTIQAATASVRSMIEKGRQNGLQTLLVGDRKTPQAEWPEGSEFLSLSGQRELGLRLAPLLPENHYGRKNLGYLVAMSRSAEVMFDTDDDNAPLASWQRRDVQVEASECTNAGWVNAYQPFTSAHIWPRGLPLEQVKSPSSVPVRGSKVRVIAPVQQGLANGSPDVDAVWRLTLDQDIQFAERQSLYLPQGAWCPFNSQSTWWFPQAYPLMYLPSFVSFRMTDIWRSFVAQRCLWATGQGVVFHGPEMHQERNPHNLLRDFEQEVPGYLNNTRICELLSALQLEAGLEATGANLHRCYEALIGAGIVPAHEMPLIEAWLDDVRQNTKPSRLEGAQ